MIHVGLIGLGAMGRTHFACWRRCRHARLVAVAARDPRLRAGDWSGKEFNLGNQGAEQADMRGITAYEHAADLIADPRVEAVDICSATPQHAPLAIAALKAGKHVLCEKPMALSITECLAMEAAAAEAARNLVIAHCLRFWPHYCRARDILSSGKYGRALYARLERTGAAPAWSSGGWLLKTGESGGIIDMHIHDIDVALWWFGRPSDLSATGYVREGLPMMIDATWRYANGPEVHLHSAWDANGADFRHAFKLVLERATLSYDLADAEPSLSLWSEGKRQILDVTPGDAYQAEIDEFAECAAEGRPFTRFTPADSRIAVELGIQERTAAGW